jgi:rhodanese-related sulfurtransferase
VPPVTKTVAQLLDEARARLRRLSPVETADALAESGLVVDIRPTEQCEREGGMPGAHVIERNVLEWRLDPASPDRIRDVSGHEQVVVLFCSEGYASSLAAATLLDMGFRNATDLAGGFQAWKAAGFPSHEVSAGLVT